MNEPSLSCLFECHMVDHKTEPSNLLNKQKDYSSAVAFETGLECKSSQKVWLWLLALIGYSFSQLIILHLYTFIWKRQLVKLKKECQKSHIMTAKRLSETDHSEAAK